jgi:prefoldin beta subunit
MQEIPPNIQHEIQQFRQMQQQYEIVVTQKQKLTAELNETTLALQELEKETDTVYKSIGSILVKTKKEDVKKELGEKKENLDVRTKTLERQEQLLLEKLKNMRAEIEQKITMEGEGYTDAVDKTVFY